MNRILFSLAALLGALMPLVFDSALKGAALLAIAMLTTLALYRASAATRHLVWVVAVVALLFVPVLSVALPQWRVLPKWAASPLADTAPPVPPVAAAQGMERIPPPAEAAAQREATTSIAPLSPPTTSVVSPPPASTSPALRPTTHENPRAWRDWLPLAWCVGFALLALRLLAAHLLLRRASRHCPALTAPPYEKIAAAFGEACAQLGITQRVTLLLDQRRTIPVVWGVFRPRLLLPIEARSWSEEQLRSVLLHELAHIKRRDTLVQWLTQVACALHWWNPLVWLAAWRLHAERERACDDLVLASGVRPSAYAEHLLDIVTKLSPARWTSACGLAMARKSSLEGRLLAVLSQRLNRRGVTRALTAAALILGTVVAIPLAMLRAADDEWNPPNGAHIGGNDFSALCIHDGKGTSFVIAYHGDFDSTNRSSSNVKARTWTNDVTLTAKKPGIALSFHRTHTAPGKLSITTGPAEARDLSKPAPAPRDFGQKEYDLAQGRVFLLTDSGAVRQLDIATPLVTDQPAAKKLAALIAAVPPQEREDIVPPTRNHVGKLTREMLEGIWTGERDGVKFEIRFRWYSEHQQAHWLVQKGGHHLGLDTSVLLDAETGIARFVFRKGLKFEHEYGKLSAGEGGVLLLDVTPNPHVEDPSPITAQKGIVLTRQPGEARLGPKHKDARALYEIWQRHARLSGDIPGALIGELAAAVKVFIGYNPTWETVPTLNALLPRLDATRDWKSADAIALLDEVAVLKDSPLSMAMRRGTRQTIRNGEALPEKFADAAWSGGKANGLRAAWVLEPGAAEHRIGAALKARLLVWNPGAVAVMLQVPTWHQGGVKATDAKGAEVEVSSVEWTTMAQLLPVRLGPGEYIEIYTPGIGFGPRAGMGPWAGPRIGSSVLAKPGDDVTLTHSPVPLDGSEVGMSEDDPHVIGPGWWQAHIKTRLARELPFPADAAERTRLLDRAVRELFAAAPTAEETAAFVADTTPDALDALVKRLAARTDVVSFSGKLPTAPAKFRVTAHPHFDNQPRVVLGPGEYPVGPSETLKIVGKPVDGRSTNDAQIVFAANVGTGKHAPDPHKLEIPDGWGTWAIVCRPYAGFFYLLHKGGARKIDFTNPRKVTDTPATDLPAEFRDEVKRQLEIAGVSDAQQAEIFEKPAPPAKTPEPKTGATEEPKGEAPLQPKHESAQALLKSWQRYARSDGKIPGGLIAALADVVDWTLWTDGWLTPKDADQAARLAALEFTHTRVKVTGPQAAPYVAKLTASRSRLDGSRDWTPAEAVAMLDELTAITTGPVHLANRPFEFDESRKISPGKPLPKDLESAAWGKPAANGLRAAWLLEPAPAVAWASILEHQYPLGSVLKARVLFHNAGKTPIFFQTEAKHQHDEHNARDAKGAAIKLSLLSMSGESRIASFRLAPGEYSEVTGGGIAIGACAIYEKEFSVGSYFTAIEAVEGDEVRFSSTVEAIQGGWSRPGDPKDLQERWKATIAERIANEAPMPASAADREQLIRRVTLDIFGVVPTAEETAAFTADIAPDALAKLTARLQAKPRVEPFSGKLPTGETKFRVLAADPAADKTPRVVLGPGEYPLSGGTATSGAVTLKIVGRPVSDRRTNEAGLLFVDTEATGRVPLDPHRLNVPDGWGTWAIVCRPGEGFFYLLHKGGVRKIDYSVPRKVTDTPANDLPAEFRDEVKRQLEAAGVSAESQAEVFEKPAPPAKTPEPKTGAVSPEPKNEYALAHFRHLQKYARENGDIPGGLIALLDRSLGFGYTPKLDALGKRLDATRDWTAKETAEFLDAAAATKDWTGDDGRLLALENYDIAQNGKPLPPELASLPWGKADDGLHPALEATGLRAAFTLEPAAASYAQGSQLPVTVHYHNSGTAPLVFPVGFRSMDLAEALDGQGRDILTALTFPNGDNGQMKDGPSKPKYSVRLEPGHWISVQGARLTIAAGRHTDTPESHGIVMMAPTDATVKLKWSPMTATRNEGPGKKPTEWKVRVATCIERVSPMPKSRADRESLIRRVTLNLTGEEATAAEVAAFIADDAPDALARLTARFQALPPLARYAGWLKAGEQTFKVTPGPADYRGTVMTANGSGLYEVTDYVFLQHYGKHANLVFMPPAPVRHPHTIHVKDKEDRRVPHGIVWRHGSGVVWVAEKTRVRKFDFTMPGKLTETELPAGIASIPEELRAELVKAFPAVETAAAPAKAEAPLQPKHEYAQKLFHKWQASARTDGKIPGALIGHVAREVDRFIKQSPDSEESKKLAALRPRLDASRDWAQAEAVALLDDITAISTAPVSWADIPMQFDKARAVQGGKPLPAELNDEGWGAPAANGLRAAWLLEPAPGAAWGRRSGRRGSLVEFLYPLGTVLKARVLFHNAGQSPVVFKTETWHQHDLHTARDAKGAEISVKATWFTGITPMATFRLAPGEYCEVSGHGIAIGAGEYKEEHSTGSVGAVIEAKEGDAVTLSHSVDAAQGGSTKPGDPKDPLEFWKKTIARSIANEAPMPASSADRGQLIRRVTLDIFGVAPTAEEIAAFTADNAPDALAKLTARLQAKPRVEPFAGKLPTGETKFRVVAADPNAAKAPRTAIGPGRYVLGDGVHLQVRQVTENGKRTNSAQILFFGPDPKKESPHKPYEIGFYVPDATYAFVWERGANKLWVTEISEGEPIRFWLLGSPDKPGPQKVTVRTFDFSNPADVKLTHVTCSENGGDWSWGKIVPAAFHQPVLDALGERGKRLRDFIEPQKEKPTAAAAPKLPKLPDDAYAKPGVHCQSFREADAKRSGGELMGAGLERTKPEDRDKEPLVLGVRTASDAQWRIGGTAKVGLVVRNRSDGDVKFSYTFRLDNRLSVVVVDEAGKEHPAAVAYFDGLLAYQQMLLPAGHVATIAEFTLRFDPEKRVVSEPHVSAFHLPPGKYKLRCKWNDALPEVAHEGEWTGELVNEELEFTLAAAAPDAEKPKGAAAVKLTPDALLGFWRGTVNGENLMLSFHRPPVEKDVQLDIYFGKSTIGAEAGFTIAENGGSAAVVQHSAGGGMAFGKLIPDEAGGLKLELFGRQKGQMEVTLTRDTEPAATEPRQKEPRELFAMWKTTANEDGTIPGTFIGALATEVRAYVKAHPNLDSGMKLPKLLPRFVASRDWTQAEAIKLLDDVAYYSTAPIAARVTKSKLPSDALWRTKVEFQDIPVAIAKWSEAKDGLRIGMRVVEGEWRVGGEVNVEMWLHNAGTKDLTLKANPQRSDVGVWVVAKDSEGQDHGAANGNIDIPANTQTCVLPAGHVAIIKNFTLSLDAPGNKQQAWMQPRFRELQPGSYKLRCEWSDAERQTGYGSDFSTDKFWTGKLTTPELDFTLVAQDAPKTASERKLPSVDGRPVNARLADDRYAKSGVPLAEQTWPMPPWGAEKDGLSAGLRVIGDARLGGEVKAELWVRNSGAKDVTFSQCLRADVGLSVVAKDNDGKEHSADITSFRGKPGFHHLLLPPGHIVKVKEFNVKFGAGKNDKLEPGWVNLQLTPGDYKLRAVWSDTTSRGAAEGEWTGKLTTGEVDLKIAATNKGADAGKPTAKPPGADIVKVPDGQYVKSGFPKDELVGEGVMWNDVGDGLWLGYRITGDEWRILGKEVKVELWVQNPGDKDVKFQTTARPDIGLRMTMKGEKSAEHESNIARSTGLVLSEHRLLPAGHALKVKEFTVSLLWPENDVSGIKGHYFAIDPGAYNFHCELELPGFSATGEGGKQLRPAAGEWTGKLTTRSLNVVVVAPDAPAPKPGIRGKVLKPDGSPAAGVPVRVDDGIERWKFQGEGIPDLPRTVKTADDGTFSIEVPKNSAATNYNVFADSDAFAPMHATVPAGGDVGVMQFAKGSSVTGRVIGLDGAGLAKVGIWCKRLDWRGRGPAPAKITSTGTDGTFSLPPIATGKHLLVILTRDLGAKELAVAFANPVIEAKDDAPVAVEIRPLPTVDLRFDVRVRREKVEFPDFELRVSGTLPGVKAGDPAGYWTRQETTKLTEGRHTIAVPAGLLNVQLRADRIYMRKDDEPVFIWRREGGEKREAAHMLELGVADKPQTIGLTVQDAAK